MVCGSEYLYEEGGGGGACWYAVPSGRTGTSFGLKELLNRTPFTGLSGRSGCRLEGECSGPSVLYLRIELLRRGDEESALSVGTRPSLECRRLLLDRKKLGMRLDPHLDLLFVLSSPPDRGFRRSTYESSESLSLAVLDREADGRSLSLG